MNTHKDGTYISGIALRWFGIRIELTDCLMFIAAVAFVSLPLSSSKLLVPIAM